MLYKVNWNWLDRLINALFDLQISFFNEDWPQVNVTVILEIYYTVSHNLIYKTCFIYKSIPDYQSMLKITTRFFSFFDLFISLKLNNRSLFLPLYGRLYDEMLLSISFSID